MTFMLRFVGLGIETIKAGQTAARNVTSTPVAPNIHWDGSQGKKTPPRWPATPRRLIFLSISHTGMHGCRYKAVVLCFLTTGTS